MKTPVQRQYWALKNENPQAILFFQLGDFYELFYEDALVGARVTGMTLTARHRGTDSEMAMCGFPRRAYKDYLQQLLQAGYTVAIADQVKDGDQITRTISRVVTAGTDDTELDPTAPRYVGALVSVGAAWAIAYADVTTGEFRTASFGSAPEAVAELHRVRAAEVLLPTEIYENAELCETLPDVLKTPIAAIKTNAAAAMLQQQFGGADALALGLHEVAGAVLASGYVLQYLNHTQKTSLPHLRAPSAYSPQGCLMLDTLTLAHLEVFSPLSAYGDKNATLWGILTKPQTALGARRLRQWLLRPLTDIDQIGARHDAVEYLSTSPQRAGTLQDILAGVYDLERLLARIATGRANARDLRQLGLSLCGLPAVADALGDAPALLSECGPALHTLTQLGTELVTAINEQPPMEITQGGFIAEGFDARVDELRGFRANADTWLADYLIQIKEETGIQTIRTKFSRTFGWTLEVPKGQADRAPDTWTRRQTLVNAERFVSPDLAEFEHNVATSDQQLHEREHELFHALRERAAAQLVRIRAAADAVAIIDAALALARTAVDSRWVRPTLTADQLVVDVTAGRHPVVEAISAQPFIHNNTQLDANSTRLGLITGSNMAGKSTYLRQNALIVLLAQAGSFVPATKATLGVFERIFTRVGASDNLAEGQSTFFLEMSETARILHQANDRTLVVLDEIGRGTSTFDGLSLAWAITEELHSRPHVLTLFATHYHELIDLVDTLPHGSNFHVAIAETDGHLVFLRQIRAGGVSDSFGLQVARLAGVPSTVVTRAHEILHQLESHTLGQSSGQPSLFSAPEAPTLAPPQKEHPALATLRALRPDEVTPRQALDVLYQMHKDLA